jgi:hypothetical protein
MIGDVVAVLLVGLSLRTLVAFSRICMLLFYFNASHSITLLDFRLLTIDRSNHLFRNCVNVNLDCKDLFPAYSIQLQH